MIEISNIALATTMNSKLFKAPGYEKHIEDIWYHSLATAFWSKEIARTLRFNVEAAFLCGLLHSIGKVVILQTVADFRSSNESIMDEYDLQQLFNQYESPVSEIVANQWGLPDIVSETMTYYKHFNSAPTAAETAATVLFGSQIADHMIDSENFPLDVLIQSPALELVNLYPDEVDELLNKTDVVKSGVRALSI
ncbi:hypothetical protein AB835_15010 [Candidatus Endobugula sertula]|uniref:HDOD domain-containing protein n=1 Tax=Candidatus Endobugula sertula TaxID=62101 RepID=A0A1D2QL17_9GAMM|nr:hypothetical protein AB835_15010 [Candidatus Endobugula sertula]